MAAPQVLTMRDLGAMALILAGLGVAMFDRYWRASNRAAEAGRGSYEPVGMAGDDLQDDLELATFTPYPGETAQRHTR